MRGDQAADVFERLAVIPVVACQDFQDGRSEILGRPCVKHWRTLSAPGDHVGTVHIPLVEALATLARGGLAHGDLSAYNLLVHRSRLVLIDLPQVVDIIAHPNGRGLLTRDARNVAAWFAARGLPAADPEKLARLLVEEARLA